VFAICVHANTGRLYAVFVAWLNGSERHQDGLWLSSWHSYYLTY